MEADPIIGEAVSTALRDAAYARDWVQGGVRKKLGADLIKNVQG